MDDLYILRGPNIMLILSMDKCILKVICCLMYVLQLAFVSVHPKGQF